MGRIKTCSDCGVPLRISRDLTWRDNGVISQTRNPEHRVIFYEVDNLDDIFREIEKLTGIPIEDMLIDGKRRITREYVESQIPQAIRRFLHRVAPNALTARIIRMGRSYGYGDISLREIRNKGDDDDFQTISIRHPYSLPLLCGDTLGSKEAMAGRDFSISYREVGDYTYLLTSRVGRHPIELPYGPPDRKCEFKPGGLKYERCAACGVPLAVARCRWNLEDGTIHDPSTGRRMAVFSPVSVQAALDGLRAGVGEEALEAVVEAQRRFARKLMGREEAPTERLGWREMVGLRGLGFVKSVDFDANRVRVVVHNSCLPLFLVGAVKGIFEMVSENQRTVHRWELHGDGDLLIEVSYR